MSAAQLAQWMPGMEKMVCMERKEDGRKQRADPALSRRKTDDGKEFFDECFLLLGSKLRLCAGAQVAFKDNGLYVVGMPLHREHDFEELRTIRILLYKGAEFACQTFDAANGIQ